MKIGLALSGGGLRGVTHVGVLQALLEQGIRPNMVAGTSAGSVVAALYATGMPVSEMRRRALELNLSLIDINFWGLFKYIFRLSPDFTGFIKGERLEEYIKELTSEKKLQQTDIPLAIIATEIETGCKVVYTSKELDYQCLKRNHTIQMPTVDPIYKAVRASCAIPILFQSVRAYHYNLVDGGLKDNIPVNILRNMGADKIIAVNLGFTGQRDSRINTPWEYLLQTIDIMGNEVSYVSLQAADVLIRPKVYNISSTDFSRVEEAIERGYKATLSQIEEVKSALGKGSCP